MRRVLAVLLWVGCSERVKPIDPGKDAGCGDGFINAMLGEECEGSDLNGATCKSLGFDEGTLACSECKLIKSSCTKRCGNGVLDPGEGCDGDAGSMACGDFGYTACTDCRLDRSHCVTSPFQAANGALRLDYGGPAVVADLSPRGLGDLVIVVQARLRVEASSYTVQQGFLANTSKFSFGKDPVQAIGQGFDIVALNRDGTLDRYAFDGGQFSLRPYPDAGCSGQLLGAVNASQVATSSCDGGELLVLGDSVSRTPTNGGSCSLIDFNADGKLDVLSLQGTALQGHFAPGFGSMELSPLPMPVTSLVGADFDGDGDVDLAGVSSDTVKVLENLGATGFSERLTLPAPGAARLHAADLDLDGKPDLVWEAIDKAHVRRNQGSWVFSPFEAVFGAGLGPSLSFSVGDVDGDGDLDLVSTRSGGGEVSTSYVQLNRVR